MISGFDLAWETSKLWTNRGGERASELLDAEAPDVEYVEQHASASAPVVTYHSNYFYTKHGSSAIPVSSQEEIERATKAGIKWVLVPEKVKSLLRMVKSWFIPNSESPVEQLKKFKQQHSWQLNSAANHELEEIIRGMEPRSPERTDPLI